MPKVRQAQTNEYDASLSSYQDAMNELNSAIEGFNLMIANEWEEEVAPKIANANECIANLRQIAEEIRDELQDNYDNRSEKWQDGDKGSAWYEWIENWTIAMDVEDVDVECPSVEGVEEETFDDAQTELEYGF